MSLESILLALEPLARDLRAITLTNPGCLSERQEHVLLRVRLDLQSAAHEGGSVEPYINTPEPVRAA
jgi:hypothetical protein